MCYVCVEFFKYRLYIVCIVKAHANGRNIVGPNMLRSLAWSHNNVGTCCVQFETGQIFRPMQTDATLLAKNHQQHAIML